MGRGERRKWRATFDTRAQLVAVRGQQPVRIAAFLLYLPRAPRALREGTRSAAFYPILA